MCPFHMFLHSLTQRAPVLLSIFHVDLMDYGKEMSVQGVYETPCTQY